MKQNLGRRHCAFELRHYRGDASGAESGISANGVGTVRIEPGGRVDVLVTALSFTGVTTVTHALLPGSPAIDRGEVDAVAGELAIPSRSPGQKNLLQLGHLLR